LWTVGIFFPVLVCCSKKNLASLLGNTQKKFDDSFVRHNNEFLAPQKTGPSRFPGRGVSVQKMLAQQKKDRLAE
jgi:hypothetical protein